ncbi:hypothetical protein ALC60_07311 [Trachymyrmex zeteki]|uniref:Uncharacterized protein n=1 Tax=Mycetomoellerius zeteki TaxID=64791 RepID=A0A151X0A3_9HYME|nr:hypothetical protein ALC60_07311 [Trachymyrmex zeteki]
MPRLNIYSSFSEIEYLSWKFSTKMAKGINAVKIVERHECSAGEFDLLNFNPYVIVYSFVFLFILIVGLYLEYNEYSMD